MLADDAAEEGAGAGDVGHDLSLEGAGVVEALFLADAAEELQTDSGGRWRAEFVEQEGFDGEVAAAEGGAVADVGDGRLAAV